MAHGEKMTDPINGVSGTEVTSAGGSYSGGSFSGEHKKKNHKTSQSDLIEISKDARKKLTGSKKKTILEYLKELFR